MLIFFLFSFSLFLWRRSSLVSAFLKRQPPGLAPREFEGSVCHWLSFSSYAHETPTEIMFSFFVFFFVITTVRSHGSVCCMKATGSCRSACEQLYLDTIADLEMKQQRSLDVRNFCPPHLTTFWRCINESRAKDEESKSWRVCCGHAETEKCHRSCRTASSDSELSHHCRHSDELDLFSCIARQKIGDDCCGLARKPECHSLCRKWLHSPAHVSRSHLANTCSSPVMHCINNLSKPSALTSHQSKYNACCNKAPNTRCKESCKKTLTKHKSAEEIVNVLKKSACRNLSPNDKMLQCFVNSDHDGRSKAKLGIDAARKSCCSKSHSDACKTRCLKVFGSDWSDLKDFEEECVRKKDGENLAQCLDEVEEPCELGCDGLNFCGNFNERPNELFRSCSAEFDSAARSDFNDWIRHGVIELPMAKNLYIKNGTNCHPITWKTIACTLQLKPCHRESQTTRICRDDCMLVMDACFDWERIKAKSGHMTIRQICDLLAPNSEKDPCNTFQSFFEPSKISSDVSITRPCKSNPCRNNEYCLLNRFCALDSDCEHHLCTPGCRLGDSSKLMIPSGTYASIFTNVIKNEECHMICQCSERGHMENCAANYCKKQAFCIAADLRMEHRSMFYVECNLCVCYDGEVTCSKRQCTLNGIKNITMTTLPCNSSTEYSPVCGWNGVTYQNPQLASCAGLMDSNYKNGTCESHDPCQPHPCLPSESCVAKRRVCLFSVNKNCPQFICVKNKNFVVDGHVNCTLQPESMVCTTLGETQKNPCSMLYNNQELAYHGPCMNCIDEGKEACGVDGNTYFSTCSAMARMVHIDYYGSCAHVGGIGDLPKEQCNNVICPELKIDNCVGYTPPGACCPVCGGAVNFLFSQKQVDRFMDMLNGELSESFTVESVLSALSRQIQVAECTLQGHLTIEMTILALVVPRSNKPSKYQMEACVMEAEKLAVLVQRNSPRMSNELSLSILSVAKIVHQKIQTSSALSLKPHLTVLIIIWILR